MDVNKIMLDVTSLGHGFRQDGDFIASTGVESTLTRYEFVPTNEMSMTDLAEVLATYINVRLSPEKLNPTGYDALPANVKRYFKKI